MEDLTIKSVGSDNARITIYEGHYPLTIILQDTLGDNVQPEGAAAIVALRDWLTAYIEEKGL